MENKFNFRLASQDEVDRLKTHFEAHAKDYKTSTNGKPNQTSMLRRLVRLGLDVLEGAESDEHKIIETSQIHQKIDAVLLRQDLMIKEITKLGDTIVHEVGRLIRRAG